MCSEMVELVKETFYIKSHLENDVDFKNFARETQNNGQLDEEVREKRQPRMKVSHLSSASVKLPGS
jgi:hypothetical protein